MTKIFEFCHNLIVDARNYNNKSEIILIILI